MAKIKAAKSKSRPRIPSFARAIPCLFLIVGGFALLGLLFFYSLKG